MESLQKEIEKRRAAALHVLKMQEEEEEARTRAGKRAPPWKTRYDEFRDVHCPMVGARLLTTREEWLSACTSNNFKPKLACLKHPGTEITTTCIRNLVFHRCLGCIPCNPELQRWNTPEGYDRLVQACANVNARLLHSREGWPTACTEKHFKPKLACLKHPELEITTTTIDNIVYHKCLGCIPCNPGLQRWNTPEGYDRLVQACVSVNARLLHSRDEWLSTCTGVHFKPKLECMKHPGHEITTTAIHHIVSYQCLGCVPCQGKKTEAKLFKWLQPHLPGVRCNELKLKNASTNYDMPVDFDHPPSRLAIELDGKQHFYDDDAGYFGDKGTPQRDLEKEQQLLARGYQVLRVLQEDVWDDKNGWENWLLGEIKRWDARRVSQGLPAERARHPDAPQYLSGIYAQLRS